MNYLVKCQVCGTRVEADPLRVCQSMTCPECREDFFVPLTNVTAGLVEGDYWIQKSLGTGDVSEMFLGKRLSNNEKIFLKVLTPALLIEPEAVQNYVQRMVPERPIENPNAACGIEAGTISDLPVVVFPYCPGDTIGNIVKKQGPFKEKDALKIIYKAARCLRAAWDNDGQIHGAIKPSNILIDDDQEPHLYEFGNFKSLLLGSNLTFDHLNYSGAVADYMSPEYTNGWQLDCRTDIYAMGATLFFMLTGTRPLGGGTAYEVLQNHANTPIPDPRKINPEVSDGVAEMILHMMAKHPESRIQTWREVLGEIKTALRTASPGTDTEMTLKTQYQMAAVGADARQSKTTWIVVLVFGGILLLALAGIGIFHMMTSTPTTSTQEATPQETGNTHGQQPAPPITPPTTGVLPEDDIIVKKVAAINRFLENNPNRKDFALERFQMLLHQESDALRKAYVQKRIDTLEQSMKAPDKK